MPNSSQSAVDAESPLATISTFDVATADAGDTLAALSRQMNDNDVGALLVQGHDTDPDAVAILTERDLVRSFAEDSDAWAVDCMTRDVIIADSTMSIADAAEMMLVAGVRHLVVRRPDGALGIASMRDLFGPLLDSLD